jgi:hypothetical protein
MIEDKLGSNRSFGIIFFLVFFIISIYPIFKGEALRISFFFISVIFLILGLFNSNILKPLNILWFKFGIFLGKIISPLIMLAIFFLIVTPIGILMRILNKDLLSLKFDNSKSYWIKKDNYKNNMKNQF